MRSHYSTERFRGFVQDLKESFFGDLQGQVQQTLKTMLEVDSEQQMEEYLGLRWYERPAEGEVRPDSRNGFYERDYVTPVGVIRLRVPRTRRRSFLPRWLKRLERRSPEVAELIRQAFLRGISTGR
jgi:transposase-like protein